MLYSSTYRIAFAHYPKTAGTSISEWFRQAFPDAIPVSRRNPHCCVRKSLARLSTRWMMARWRQASLAMLPFANHSAGHRKPNPVDDIRIVGVVRPPFQMLVSLYEYWRRLDTCPDPGNPWMSAARERPFREFLRLAVRGARAMPYEHFFDVGGPAWPRTRLVQFDQLERGLQEVLDGFGLDVPVALPSSNRAPSRGRPLADYEAEAGPLLAEVRRRFRWYDDNRDVFAGAYA
ncbi:MAG: hypothetical protein K8S94_05530 [Planctomycetia bacterium]|nr:hypothetical protein [Planctomycetia bacterium]